MGCAVPPRKTEPRPFWLNVITNGCLGSNPIWLATLWDWEYPASLPPNSSGSVAPAGPVITTGRVNVSAAWVSCGPVKSNCPAFAALVRGTTVGTPGSTAPNTSERTPVTEMGRCPLSGGTISAVTATVYASSFIPEALVCDSAGRGIWEPPAGAPPADSRTNSRLVRYRERHRASVAAGRLVRGRRHRGAEEEE